MTGFDHHDPDVEALMWRRSKDQAQQPGVRAARRTFTLPLQGDSAALNWSANPGDWVAKQGDESTFSDLVAGLVAGITDQFNALSEKWQAAAESLAAVCVGASDSFQVLGNQLREQETIRVCRDNIEQNYRVESVTRVDGDIVTYGITLLDKSQPQPAAQAPPLRHGPLGVTCPRHGPMHGGICHRCRR